MFERAEVLPATETLESEEVLTIGSSIKPRIHLCTVKVQVSGYWKSLRSVNSRSLAIL